MNLWNRCRTCLSKVSLKAIFPNSEQNVQYCEVIYKVTGLKVQINDSLPQKICTTCADTLNQIISFQNTCQRSHSTLMDWLYHQNVSSVKIESENEFTTNHTPNEAAEPHYGLVAHIDDQSDNNSYKDDEQDEPRTTKTENCTEKYIEFESTVEEILRKRMNFSFVNYKLGKRVKQYYQKGKEKSLAKIKAKKDKQQNVTNRFSNCDEVLHLGDVELNPQPNKKLQDNKVEEEHTQFQCEYCFKMYNNKVSYVNHTKIHTGLKVICEHCGKEFLDKRRLLMHCRSKHGYQKTDKCTYCDYLGISPESVKIHERIHTGEKPYKCKECPASFHRSSSYLQHTARHLPEKTVQCQQCPALFKSVTLMRIHANRHKPRDHKFKCLVCGGNFSSRSSVGRHLRRAHAVARCTQAHLQRVKLNEP